MLVNMAQKWIAKVTGQTFEAPDTMDTPIDAVAGLCRNTIPNDGQEHLVAVAMDCHGTPLAVNIVATGSVDNCPLYPRDVYAWALSIPRVRFVGVAHNHPSGDVTPSGPDGTGTAVLAKAGQYIGLDLVWSLVVTHESEAWSIIPIKEPKGGRGKGGDDAEPSRPQDPDEDEDNPGNEPDPGDEPVDGEPDKPEPNPDATQSSGGTGSTPTTTEDELKRAVAKVFGVRTTVDQSNVYRCKDCGHVYSDPRPCPECGGRGVRQ